MLGIFPMSQGGRSRREDLGNFEEVPVEVRLTADSRALTNRLPRDAKITVEPHQTIFARNEMYL
jgi:hypothetical protein